MRFKSKKPSIVVKIYGDVFKCNHPIYDSGTLFKEHGKGLVIIQQYFDEKTKRTWWGPIEDWVANYIYLNEDYMLMMDKYSDYLSNGLYPTISVRHAMNWLKMKPLEKKPWETVFDRIYI